MIRPDETSRIVFGCGNFGGMGSSPAFRDLGDDAATAWALLDAARAAGLTRFDTANTYGGGASETLLGQWLARQDAGFRSRIQVATKVGNPHGCPSGDTPLSRGQVADHLDRSLRRLGVERIGLYYLHEFDGVTPLEETLEAVSRAAAAGKIDAFGISNAALAQIEAVLALADGALRARFAYVQNEFNALETGDLAEVVPFCAARGLRYTAFSPLAGGVLSGKYSAGAAPGADTRVGQAIEFYGRYLTPETFATLDILRARAEADGGTVAGAALRFILDAPQVDSLIIAPRKVAHLAGYGLVPQ